MNKIFFLVAFSIICFSKELTFGIVPQQSPLKLSKKWINITDYLTKETGINIIFKTESSIPKFEKKLYSSAYDISYMNPFHFVVAREKQNYKAFIRAKKNIVGILVSKTKKNNLSFEYLKEKIFLFPAPNAFAATILPKNELKDKFGLDFKKDIKVMYVNSHDSVYKGISRNIGDIGGGIIRTFNDFKDSKDKANLNIIYRTKPYPSHPIAYHPRVTISDIKKLKKAFLKMPRELKSKLSIKEFISIDSNEYDIIKNGK